MSYEGYTQNICANGHVFNSPEYFENSDPNCPLCNAVSVFNNPVDETNGDSYGVIPPSEFKKLLLTPDEKCVCACCNNEHIKAHATYRIPSSEEVRAMRHYYDYKKNGLVPIQKNVKDK